MLGQAGVTQSLQTAQPNLFVLPACRYMLPVGATCGGAGSFRACSGQKCLPGQLAGGCCVPGSECRQAYILLFSIGGTMSRMQKPWDGGLQRCQAMSMTPSTGGTQVCICHCRAQSAGLFTCQPALKPTYHFSMPKLQNSTAAAQTAGAGGRRLLQSLGTPEGTQIAPARTALRGRRLSQTTTVVNNTQAAPACKRIAYYQSCGAAPCTLSASLQEIVRYTVHL